MILLKFFLTLLNLLILEVDSQPGPSKHPAVQIPSILNKTVNPIVLAPQFTTLEIDVGCSFGGGNCSQVFNCAQGCLDCVDNIFKCKVCALDYFLFTLPQDDDFLQLKRDDQICISCPFQSYTDNYAIYCGDCIENSRTWESSRICSYDYVIRGSNSTVGAYQQRNKTQNDLFFVTQNQLDKSLILSYDYIPYQTTLCQGCGNFCPIQTLICLPVDPQFSFDSSKQFVSCGSGFVYNIAIDTCDQCPNNCQTCTITTDTSIVAGEIVYNITKQCLVCNSGFMIFTGYPKRILSTDPIGILIDTRCEPCFYGCLNCYFGNDLLNLNQRADQWSLYMNSMRPQDYWSTVQASLSRLNISERCQQCSQTSRAYYLPSLDMLTCVTCLTNCGECEYVTYNSTYVNTPQQYPTRNAIPIVLASDQAYFISRCRKCVSYLNMFSIDGQECDENTIGFCQIAYYTLSDSAGSPTNTTTLDPDYTPTLKGNMTCGLCFPLFQLTLNKTFCTPITAQSQIYVRFCLLYQTQINQSSVAPPSNQATSNNQASQANQNANTMQICAQCLPGYTLNSSGNCNAGCAFVLGDFFCSSCYNYTFMDFQNNTIPKTRCLVCVDGYYPNILTGLCSPCSLDPNFITCISCQQYSYQQIYSNTIIILRPSYTDTMIENIKNYDNVNPQTSCNKCVPGINKNAYTGFCETCKSNCLVCDPNALTSFCAQCIPSIVGRSTTLSGNDCLTCPQNCIGCRERSQTEIQNFNPYFAPDNTKFQFYSRICYKCQTNDTINGLPVIYNSNLGRCTTCQSIDGCYLSAIIDIYMYCVSGSSQKQNSSLANAYIDLPSYYQIATSPFATIEFQTFESDDNFFIWNNMGLDTMTLNINIIQNSGAQSQNQCLMSKDTYITTGISQNVFSVQNLKLNILVRNETLGLVTGQSNIVLYIYRNLYIQYFNDVSINGLQISPSIDYNYKYPDLKNPYPRKNAFGIILNLNTKCSLRLYNVHILQTQAQQVYNNKSQYVSPQDPAQILLKKYNPFFFNLLNIYNLELNNVTFTSFSYLVDQEVKFNGMPFTLIYDSPQTMMNITFTDVQFEDIAIEARSILQLQQMTFQGNDPSIVQFITIDGLVVQDSYFINGAGLFSQNPGKTDSCGVINVTGLKELRDYHNSSNGLFNFWTAQKMVFRQALFQQNFVNNTFQFHVNTLDMSDVIVLDSVYTVYGRFINTQDKAPQFKPGRGDLSGITFSLGRTRFANITCLSLNCLIFAQTPQNVYYLLMNITLSSINIGNFNSSGYAPNLIDSANSAMMFFQHISQITINDFLSFNNKNLTILNINDVQSVSIDTYSCLSNISNIQLANQVFSTHGNSSNKSVHKDNMCLYVSNFYLNITVNQLTLQYLVGIDNSFVVFSSWDTLIYNTTQPGVRERIILTDFSVQSCTIYTSQISSVSSSVFVESKQMQQVYLSNSQFLHNTQIQLLVATVTPSNPTFLTQSIVGEIAINTCIWRDNQAGGFGAVLYIQMGTANLTDIIMVGSNWLRTNQVFQINSVSYGGHLYLYGYNLYIQNCSFQNATAVRGSGVYIQSVADGLVQIHDSLFLNLLTPLTPAAESRGGCLYVDSSSSRLQMTIDNVSMSNCSVRGEGGCIFLQPSERDQNVQIMNSGFFNCFSLGGSMLKVTFDQRTVSTQSILIQDTFIQQSYWEFVDFMAQVNDQNLPNGGLNAIEQYLYIQRSSVIEQDSGYISLMNVDASYINFQGLLSLNQVRSINLEEVQVSDSIIMYRPLIEVINPFLYPTVFDRINFRNITSYIPESIDCTANSTDYNTDQQFRTSQFKCNLMQIKIEYPDQLASPAIILVTSVTLQAPLQLTGISIESSVCYECFGGLISIQGVYNGNPNIEMVKVVGFVCQNSTSGYYGCLFASSLPLPYPSPDDSFLNFTYVSRYQLDILKQKILQVPKLSLRQKDYVQTKMAAQHERRLLQNLIEENTFKANQINGTNQNDQAFIPMNLIAAHIRLQNVKVHGLNASYGGAIGIRGLTANITNLDSYQCHGNGSGGTVYFQADPKIRGKVQQRLNLWNNLYVESQAKIGGAIRTLESGTSSLNKSQVTFFNNLANYFGNDVATYPQLIQLIINGTNQKQLTLNQNIQWVAKPIIIKSGQAFNNYQQQQIVFALMDGYNNYVNYQMGTVTNFQTNPATHLSGSGKRDFTIDVQGFDFSNLVINNDPYVYKTLDVYITSSAIFIPVYIDSYPFFLKEYDQNYTLKARIRAVECGKGETFDITGGTCLPCGPGTYALDSKSVCKTMNDYSMNETFLNQISIYRGFWRSEIQIDTAEFCFNQPQNCKGGWNVGNSLCTEGNIGALCEACDWYGVQWGESYSSSEKFSCVKCSNASNNLIILVLLSIWTLYSIITSIKGTKEQMELQYLDQICRTIGWSSGIKAKANSAIMIKMLTNYSQIVGVISQFQLTVPSTVFNTVATVSQPTSSVGHSMECLLLTFNPGLDVLYWRIIWSLILQVIYITIILFSLLVGHLSKKLEFKAQYVQTMVVFLFIFLHPSYVQDFILLVSKRVISEEKWVHSNVSYRYDTKNHQKWMAMLGWPGVFMWAIFFPLIFLFILYSGNKRGKLNNIFFRNSWGFFYNEYRAGCYYWEFVKIFQKELIIIILIFFYDDVITKGILIFVVIYLYGRATLHNRPYNYTVLNKIDIWSNNCCALTIIFGVLIYQSIINNSGYIVIISYIVLGLLNSFFIICIIYFLLYQYFILFGETIDEYKEKIIAKKPHLKDDPKYKSYLVNRTKLNLIAKKKWKYLALVVSRSILRLRQDKALKITFLHEDSKEKITKEMCYAEELKPILYVGDIDRQISFDSEENQVDRHDLDCDKDNMKYKH